MSIPKDLHEAVHNSFYITRLLENGYDQTVLKKGLTALQYAQKEEQRIIENGLWEKGNLDVPHAIIARAYLTIAALNFHEKTGIIVPGAERDVEKMRKKINGNIRSSFLGAVRKVFGF